MTPEDDIREAIKLVVAGKLVENATADDIADCIMLVLSNWTAKEPE